MKTINFLGQYSKDFIRSIKIGDMIISDDSKAFITSINKNHTHFVLSNQLIGNNDYELDVFKHDDDTFELI